MPACRLAATRSCVRRRGPRWAILSLALVLAATWASGAVIEQRTVSVRIERDAIVRDDALTVRLEGRGDLDSWSEYPILLDADTVLTSCVAEVISASGKVEASVPMRRHRRVESLGYGLYSSAWASVIPFPPLRAGQRLRIHYSVRQRPLYPAFDVALQLAPRQEHLRVTVAGGAEPLRFTVQPASRLLRVVGDAGGVTVEGADVPAYDPPDGAPPSDLASPMLRVAWGGGTDWRSVGAWYEHLSVLPPKPGPVGELARSMCPRGADRRECLEALARYVKTKVRYEAVEIERGQWAPTPPEEVLARRWGDCKDKAQLLRALLDAVDIPSRLVLIRSGRAGEVDPDFPWPFSFNHCILALPDGAVPQRPDDPVASGYLWVDPTSELGGVEWLTTACQGRPALVVSGGDSALVRTPERPQQERRDLRVSGRIYSDGSLVAETELRIEGARAEGWIRDLRSEPDDRIAESVTRYLQVVLPGAKVSEISWESTESEVPGLVIQARVAVPGVAHGNQDRRAVLPHGLLATPEPRVLDDREVPVVLRLGVHHTRWEVTLPEGWCPPVPVSEEVGNGVGRFALEVAAMEGGGLVFDRTVELDRSLVGPDGFDDLKALAVAENRAAKRRIRLRCQ
jgi:cellulose synthase operon protein C